MTPRLGQALRQRLAVNVDPADSPIPPRSGSRPTVDADKRVAILRDSSSFYLDLYEPQAAITVPRRQCHEAVHAAAFGPTVERFDVAPTRFLKMTAHYPLDACCAGQHGLRGSRAASKRRRDRDEQKHKKDDRYCTRPHFLSHPATCVTNGILH